MQTISFQNPHQILSTAVPPPPHWLEESSFPMSDSEGASSTLPHWKGYENSPRGALKTVLWRLQQIFRAVHKRKIAWPIGTSPPSDLSPSEYLIILLSPIPDIFNQLHCPGVLDNPMKLVQLELGEGELYLSLNSRSPKFVGIHGFTFEARDFERWNITAPVILLLPGDLFDSQDRITPPVKVGLSRVLKHTPSVPSIIVTNLQDIVLFLTPTARRPGYCFEKIVTDNPPLALRAISTAYLYDKLPDPYFINIPSLDGEDYGPALVLPEGPHQDPAQPLHSDEEVFFGCQRHSDFDLVTLFRDRARALQFFRWHEHVQKEYAKLVAHPGDAISAVTNQFGRAMPDMHPIFPLNLSELPPDTAAHIKEIERESPLLNTGFEELFLQSQRFTLQVDDIITEGSENGICTVYRCSITSIDGTNLSAPSPALCLKLFDDRFQKLDCPTKEFLEQLCDNEVPLSSGQLLIAEILALNEVFTYNKLRVVQGSAFPLFYGMHQFTLPNGMVLYGLLMEYIEGWSLNSAYAQELSPDRQAMMIRSARQASRVLDVADITQHDWHSGQILLYTNPSTKLDHVVLIDFNFTSQTWDLDELNSYDNYFGVLRVLLGHEGNVAIKPEFVWDNFGDPDDWDPVQAWLTGTGGEKREVAAQDMFPYILST
ncbi:hypothetical protein D9756_011326 [Leucocoprinus leucothites]|uniref:Uncharacterized protein n=1 Tax=Leucocoprinus leucothites TaxID=201217 RepID=A0A8H5CM17_9AGAR|nr:hypothetical protein D9756_011326 [Leucoagaricus leucothites]